MMPEDLAKEPRPPMKIHGTRTQGSPRRLAVFLEEKGLAIPFVPVDLRGGEHRTPGFLAKNPLGLVPVLELDDGTCLAETTSIARYLEELFPDPPFFGRDPLERARLDSAARQVELGFYTAVRAWFRHGSPLARALEPVQIPAWSELARRQADDALRLLDRRLADHAFVAGPDFSWADITLVTSLEGTIAAGYAIPDDCPNVQRWFEATAARPSVVATRPA
jgi:glutathione S-transferase